MVASVTIQTRDVATVLEHFICPGGKLRLSPYVEAVQCLVLLGDFPDPRHHSLSLRELVRQSMHASKFDAIARRMVERAGVEFNDTFFAARESLDLYFAHYFPANLGKLQLVLLDLLRVEQFPERLHLVDLGVGTGTSFVAVLDFVLALGAMVDLATTPFPLVELTLTGYDRSSGCLAYTRDVLEATRTVLARYRELDATPAGARAGPGLTAAWNLVEKALADVSLRQGDIGGSGHIHWAEPSFAVLSYVLNELRDPDSVETLQARLGGLPEGSRLIVLGPGHQNAATQLMAWRRSLVRRMPHLRPVLPCGQEFGIHLPAACDRCWCARREEVHGSPLQRAYLDRLDEYLTACDPERRYQIRLHFERLSWAYCVLASGGHGEGEDGSFPPAGAAQRYIGRRRRAGNGSLRVVGGTDSTGHEHLLAFCPARAEKGANAGSSAALVQDPGKVLPPLRFGELVVLEQVEAHKEGGDILFTLNRTSRVRSAFPPADPAGFTADTASLNALAQRLFGFSPLHDFQHKIIHRVLEGRNTLGIAATASGKTECFLLPALLLPGLTVVVSPLKSLMQDQWERC